MGGRRPGAVDERWSEGKIGFVSKAGMVRKLRGPESEQGLCPVVHAGILWETVTGWIMELGTDCSICRVFART